MESSPIHIRRWLMPLSWLYGAVTAVRNWLYEAGWLQSCGYDIPVICVGNITAGGTGKTPHVEYLLSLLLPHCPTAVLSRGYKRRSRGYLLAGADTPASALGDEPWQMKHKQPRAYVAVDADRRRGIARLMQDERTRDVAVILLDDAFQHRRVRAGLNILLTDYHRLLPDDALLPAGLLRESPSGIARAQIVVVTKCPRRLHPMEYRIIRQRLGMKPWQDLYFSTMRYGSLHALYGDAVRPLETLRRDDMHVLLLSGIANPQQLESDARMYVQYLRTISYPDHHPYRRADLEQIRHALEQMPQPRIIVTTEKDAARLCEILPADHPLAPSIYVLPIQVEILREQTTAFNEKILNYVHENPRNSSMAQG